MRRLEVADLSLSTLDVLDVDALAVLVGPERPLQGLAGLVDWRLCGALTRALRGGLFGAAAGEALLLPTGGRVPATRVVAIGLPSPNRPPDFAAAARRACEVLARAGSTGFATALPALEGGDLATAVRLFLEAGEAAPKTRQVLLGDARVLLAELASARAAAGAPVEIAAFAARPAAMVR
jgi:Cytosol aminopeptidase family, N-terminal domain